MAITPDERKAKVSALREEHEDYFQTNGIINALHFLSKKSRLLDVTNSIKEFTLVVHSRVFSVFPTDIFTRYASSHSNAPSY